jgi:hypothetical protein
MPADLSYTAMAGPRLEQQLRFVARSQMQTVAFARYAVADIDVEQMPKLQQGVAWDTFRWVVGGLMGVIAVLIAGGFSLMIKDISDINQEISSMRKDTGKEFIDTRVQLVREIAETRIETTKAIGVLQTQAATTNAKLDELISAVRRR